MKNKLKLSRCDWTTSEQYEYDKNYVAVIDPQMKYNIENTTFKRRKHWKWFDNKQRYIKKSSLIEIKKIIQEYEDEQQICPWCPWCCPWMINE